MISIRKATRQDMAAVLQLIRELALYEKAPEAVTVTEEQLARDGFGPQPLFHIYLAETGDGHIAGMAFYNFTYSTWKGRILYLDDLIVRERYRRLGVGRQLFRQIARVARQAKVAQMRFHVLDWNEPAIAFYKQMDMDFEPEWVTCKLDRQQISKVAEAGAQPSA